MAEPDMTQTADKIRDFLKRSRDEDGYSLQEVLALAQEFANAAKDILDIRDEAIVSELRHLVEHIQKAEAEIAALQPRGIQENSIPKADAELRAVVEHTGEATNAIMAAAEELMGADSSDADAYQALVNDKVMEIFEACSFQDITGQRITKVANILKYIEERLARFAAIAGALEEPPIDHDDRRDGGPGMAGPALRSEANDQDAIDALFDD